MPFGSSDKNFTSRFISYGGRFISFAARGKSFSPGVMAFGTLVIKHEAHGNRLGA